MKVLIGNFHNSVIGGGEYYTFQCAKAISAFANILFVKKPNAVFLEQHPELKCEYKIWDRAEEIDCYVNISHFSVNVCGKARKNVHACFFPNHLHKVGQVDEVVTICDYVSNHAKKLWGVDSTIIEPYSNDYKATEKRSKSIVTIGNLFKEADGHSKHQDKLIEALALLDGAYTLDIIGGAVSTKYVNHCMNLAKGHKVNFHIGATEEKKKELLESSEFYWHANGFGRNDPYQTEHFGIALIEAIKAGCKTYAHNSGGPRDFCATWDSISELVSMTKYKADNLKGVEFQTPENMTAQWRELLCRD